MNIQQICDMALIHIAASGPVTRCSIAIYLFYHAPDVGWMEMDIAAGIAITKLAQANHIERYDDDSWVKRESN